MKCHGRDGDGGDDDDDDDGVFVLSHPCEIFCVCVFDDCEIETIDLDNFQ